MQLAFPAGQQGAGPIAVSAADVGSAVFGQFRDDPGDLGMADIIGINQQGDVTPGRAGGRFVRVLRSTSCHLQNPKNYRVC